MRIIRAPSLRSTSTASLSPEIFQPSALSTSGPTRMKWYLLTNLSIGKVAIFGSFGFGLALVLFSSAPSPEFSGSFLFWFVFLTELRKAVPFITDWICKKAQARAVRLTRTFQTITPESRSPYALCAVLWQRIGDGYANRCDKCKHKVRFHTRRVNLPA